MILLYTNPVEIKYVKFHTMVCIGIGAKYLHNSFNRKYFANQDKIILFGSCGRLDSNLRDYGELIIPGAWSDGEGYVYIHWNMKRPFDSYGITTDHKVQYKWERKAWAERGFYCVDQESYHVAKLCKELDVEFVSVRYMIDRCDRKCMPIGINHWWRKYQHKRMQLKFNEWLKREGY